MEMNYFKDYSPALGRDMEVKVYGHAGQPVLFIPCQDGRFFDFENYKMIDYWWDFIESGKVMVFAIDTIDKETYSNETWDNDWKVNRHEQWFSYICNEMAPFMQAYAKEKNGWSDNPGITAFGCSLGATHAVNLALRWPDIFTGCLALSGIYTSKYGFGDYSNELIYNNSPVDYLANMPSDHEYIEKYNRNKIILCVGQGPWEIPETTFRMKEIFEEKGIGAWVDVWGYDTAHDWDWWYKQVIYFLPYLF